MDTKLKCEMFSKYISTSTSYFLVKERVFVSKSSETEGDQNCGCKPHMNTAILRGQLVLSGTLNSQMGLRLNAWECFLFVGLFLFLNLSPTKLISK